MNNKNVKEEYPEPGELVIGTVESIFKQGAFITLDEYNNKRGLLHISEISLKWVRNIRDYVREGQKIVLQVLKVNPERGHIDLSLRRVSDAQRREKLQEVKYRQRSNKLLGMFAKSKNVSFDEIMDTIGEKLIERYGSVYEGLEAIAMNNTLIDDLGMRDEWKGDFLKLVNENIKIPFVEITGYVKLRSYQPDGIEDIKNALKKIEEFETGSESEITVLYDSPPIYRIRVKSTDYKSAERVLRDAAKSGIELLKRNKGEGEFYRELHKDN